ncbi:ankyrin repeat and SOCS box protein 15-like isoform X1 [Brienomyrus brachyistius]|uniref:ankyrin repeat and SOCS box protein 15-like isoform X1 n=1 Tax=Brienomyrus brachyistius TaxID=42636 RepID=UPI0020B448A9|nr:ankyrin repeat and SOCS box protein 15-like isoform X1 [Brienomyrus brachyistius]
MSVTDEVEEDDVTQYVIQLSIQESHIPHCLQAMESSKTQSSENLKILLAIDQGEMFSLQELADFQAAFEERDGRGWLPLHTAAVQPVADVLEMVMYGSCRLGLEEKTWDGETALTLAVKADLLENVKVLLENGASPHSMNDRNESPLLLAVRMRSLGIVSLLIKSGALVDQACQGKWTSMHEVARLGCGHLATMLLRTGASVSQKDRYGVTPLGIAAQHGQLETLDMLIRYGSNVNAQACNGESVLMEAAGSGNPDCVELLLRHGADPDLAGVTGHLPIHRAAYEGHYLALKILIPITSKKAVRLSGQSPIHSAADGGHAQCLRLLIDNGYEVNTVLEKHISENYGDRRRSPLYFAVSNGDAPCTEMLLNAGAKPDRDPLRCLLVAVRAGYYEIVRLLLSKQADVNCYFTAVSDTVFPTALQYCLRDEIMMRLLLNHGYAADRCFCCHHDDSVAWCPHWSDLSSQLFETYNPEEKIPFCDFIAVSCLQPLAGQAVRILLDYVGHVSVCTKLRLILERQKEWPAISEILGNPRPLKHLCRLVIRKQVTLRRLSDPRVIDSAPFPHRITDYLLYREHDLYSQNIGAS